MDLTRLASLPEDDLRALARRFAIADADELDRYELIEAIRKKTRPTGALARARELASGAFELAKAIAAIAAPPPIRHPSTKPTEPAPPAPQRFSDLAPPPTSPSSKPTALAPPAPQRFSDVAPTPAPSSAPTPPPPVLSESERVLLAREPIQTRTMARLLAQQGHGRRAAAIYAKLLVDQPHDSTLRDEAANARDSVVRPATEPADEEDDPDEVVAARIDDDRFVLAWRVDPRSIDRARRLLGAEGALTRRTVVIRPDAAHFVRKEEETAAAAAEDAIVLEGVRRDGKAVVAIGLADGERFVSIAHRAIG